VRLLLGVAALNRVIEWWQAERSFWATTTTSSSTPTTVTPLFKPLGNNINTILPPLLLNQQPEAVDSEQHFDDISRTTTNRAPRTRDNSVMSTFMQNEDEDNTICQLQEEAEIGQSSTIVMELSLTTPTVQYLSPVWHDVIG
jgi:hypothetical protein